jgi:hypothetical protein
LIVYIKIPDDLEQTIFARAESDPKPLYYREDFLDEKLDEYLQLKSIDHTDSIEPDDFVSWVFPELFKSRLPRYQEIAKQYGYTINAHQVGQIQGEDDFIQLIADAIATNQ